MHWRRTLVVAMLVVSGVSCQSGNQRTRPTKMSVSVSVIDEAGKPVTAAVMTAIGNTKPIDIPGTRELKIDQPVAGTIEAEGFVPEPFVIDPFDTAVTVKLFSRIGPSGAQRLSFQFGGDVMMGRRYQEPVERSDTPIATTDAGAESVVRHVAPLMAVADASTVNLETVVGQLPFAGAYPAKRFLLQSPPVVLSALRDLGVDLVTLGNNHAYDWQAPGVASTISALDGAGIAWAGAGTTAEQAEAGRMIEVRGVKVGLSRRRQSTVTSSTTTFRAPMRSSRPAFPSGMHGSTKSEGSASESPATPTTWSRRNDVRVPPGRRLPSSNHCSMPINPVRCGLRWRRSIQSCRTGWHGAATVARHRFRRRS